ncbi:Serine/threonine-protein kinase TOR [Capsicum baccatum]|uniref:Serine/threonine-protein kinase TOR n=1 Tax=Capsicum baccatum TaxID=33114 RepID=A0A2G2XFQ0_CAPBA|nr:Serine/threonine-protein kinase TOR [Capsicum baccatum]
MGSSFLAIHYPVATTGTGNIDALKRVLADLCTRSNPKRKKLVILVEKLLLVSWIIYVNSLLHFLIVNEVSENLGALRAIDELIDVTISKNASKVAKFSNYMSAAFETKRDPEILVLASKVLGHLDRSGATITADEVECQVKIALEWLRGESIEYQRFAAVIILKVALRDPTLVVQEKAIEVLRTCLCVIEKREIRWSVQWYYRMFEATQDGLGRNAPVHSIHGSLLAVGELLRNTGEFMMSRYREVAEIVVRYLKHQDRLVCLSITSPLPRIAHFLRDRFVTNYLTICMNHILHVLKIPAERASGFIALGEIAGALDGELTIYLPTITSHLRDVHSTFVADHLDRLLKCISAILSRSHHSMPRQLASGHDLLVFAREFIVMYLEDEDGATRKDAALCCRKLVANSFSVISSTQFSLSRINCASGKRRRRLVEELTALEVSSNIYHGYLKGSTGSEKLNIEFEPIELEVDEESKTEPDEEEFQMDADLDDAGEVKIEGVDVLEIEEASAIQLAELRNESDSSERDLDRGLTISNVEVELAKSQSFIADNALESMIDNPKSIVKEISAVEESQPLETMESPIRHDEDNVGAYQILGISSLVLILLVGTNLYVKRRSDKTLHPVAVLSKKFATHHVVKEKHSSQNWPTEVDVAGARRLSEMSIFQISSYHTKKYPKSEDDEAQSIEKKSRKSDKRESLDASEFSMGSPSYGSFTTYERIPAKHASGGEEVTPFTT